MRYPATVSSGWLVLGMGVQNFRGPFGNCGAKHLRRRAPQNIGKTGVTADHDKIEFRLFNSSLIFNITLREDLLSSPKQKTNHTSLFWFHGASHRSQVPWREVEDHYSPGDEPSVTLAQLHNELTVARAHLRWSTVPSTTSNDLNTSSKWDGSNEILDWYKAWVNDVSLWANNNQMAWIMKIAVRLQ